jgi:tetratricopeptide (TPR) repeat protein
LLSACNYATHRTLSDPSQRGKEDPEPDYNISLDENYQDFASYLFMGNRIENFSTYFNTFYIANEDYESAMKEYRTSTIANYNRRLDSLNVTPVLTQQLKDKFTNVIERASKVIQYHKNSKFIDDAVLLIGKSYFYLTDYPQAERSFNEFLSKLNASDKSDEAILFLGRSNLNIGKSDEAVNILSNLVKDSRNNEIKASASEVLGVYEFNKKNYEQAVEYFKASINFSEDKDKKAERQFILAKMYSLFNPSLAAAEYSKAVSLTSDYDLRFYSRLNYARGLNYNKDFNRAFTELEDLKGKYRDDLIYRQMVDLENANTLYNQKQYDRAKREYFEVIIDYPSTTASAEAYYSLAKYYEEVGKDYLNALVNYKKAVSENTAFDYYSTSNLKVSTFDRYFQLQAEVNGSEKIEIPVVNNELESYRIKYNESKGIVDPNIRNNEGSYRGGIDQGEGKGKPGGYKTASDTLEDKNDEVEEDKINEEEGDKINEEKIKEFHNNNMNNEGPGELEIKEEDKSLDEGTRFSTYYELAEIFLYELNQRDSAEFYLTKLLNDFPESSDRVKIMYIMASFYKDSDSSRAENLYRQIIERYPNTQYSVESRKALGLPSIDISKEPAEDLYKNAVKDLDLGNYYEASLTLKEIVNNYPQSSYYAQSIYTLGWIYENRIHDIDSTVMYYSMLWEKFPESEFSIRVTPVLEYLLTEKNNKNTENENMQTSEGKDENEETTKDEVISKEEEKNEEKEQDPENEDEGKERLSQEEIEKLLKDSGD